MNEMPTDIVHALQMRWMTAFHHRDVEGLVALYAEGCFLFGGRPALSCGRSDVRTYFNAVPAVVLAAQFGEQSVHQLGPDVITSAGFVTFARDDGEALRYRITLTFVRAGGVWQIASHHASPVPGWQPQQSEFRESIRVK